MDEQKEGVSFTAQEKLDLLDQMRAVVDGDADYDACKQVICAVLESCEESVIRSWCGLGSGFNIFGTERMAFLIATTALQIAMPWDIYAVIKQSSGEFWEDEEEDGEVSVYGHRTRLLDLIEEYAPVKKFVFPDPYGGV